MFAPPKLVNTDGDPLVFHDIYYEIDSSQAAFDKLKTLAVGVEEQELLSEAEFDKKGKLVEIEFPWLKLGNPKIKSWENTVVGNISPTKAIKDPDGREMVKALLDQIELRDRNAAPNQKQQKYIDWARQQLGLV